MTKIIEQLTPDQEALIPVYLEKWRKIALSTEPCDREKAAEAVKAVYAVAGLSEPEIIFCNSPYEAIYTVEPQLMWSQKTIHLEDYLWDFVWGELLVQLKSQLSIGLWILLQGYLDSQILNFQGYNHLLNQEERELSYQIYENGIEGRGRILANKFDFCISVLGCDCELKKWEAYKSIALECGLIFPYKKAALICDRPRILSFDARQRLHAEGSPAIKFADGFSIYAYHGVRLPEKYGKIHPQQWQSQWLLSEDNAELRRVLIQGIGYDRICQELPIFKIDTWQEYELLKIDSEVDEEPIYLLKMTCPSTGFIHVLRVPPDARSAKEAITWINWGIAPEDFFRTNLVVGKSHRY